MGSWWKRAATAGAALLLIGGIVAVDVVWRAEVVTREARRRAAGLRRQIDAVGGSDGGHGRQPAVDDFDNWRTLRAGQIWPKWDRTGR